MPSQLLKVVIVTYFSKHGGKSGEKAAPSKDQGLHYLRWTQKLPYHLVLSRIHHFLLGRETKLLGVPCERASRYQETDECLY